jgi:hypothetical protein
LVLVAFRAKIPESNAWEATSRDRSPVRAVTVGAHRCDLAQVLALMTGLWLVATSVVSVLPRMLTTVLGWSATQVTGVLLVAQLGVFAGFVATGTWGQSHGRRRALVAGALSGPETRDTDLADPG